MDENNISELITQLLQTEKVRNYEKIKQDMLAQLEQERTNRNEYEDRLYFRWKNALDLFETILLLSRNAGAEYNQQIRPYAAKQNDFLFEVLTRIHARSCMTTFAILSLLKSGHASDALARARTLHELRVIATLINGGDKDGDKQLAEMYLSYEVVESLRIARDYEKHYKTLGLQPLKPGTRENLELAVEKYHAKFMPHLHQDVLKGDYGWAAVYLKNAKPSFRTIEENVGLSHLRPYYQFANHPVHAGVKGIKFDVGYVYSPNLLFAGPSNAGLTDPASFSLRSLTATTALLLTYMAYLEENALLEIYLKSLVAAQLLQELVDEADQAFFEAHKQLERDELEIQAK